MYKTIYVKKDFYEQYRLENYPSAGPKPNVRGMKNLFWGNDAYCLKHGNYVYKVPQAIYREAVRKYGYY